MHQDRLIHQIYYGHLHLHLKSKLKLPQIINTSMSIDPYLFIVYYIKSLEIYQIIYTCNCPPCLRRIQNILPLLNYSNFYMHFLPEKLMSNLTCIRFFSFLAANINLLLILNIYTYLDFRVDNFIAIS